MLNDFRDKEYRPRSVAPGCVLRLMALVALAMRTILVGILASTAPPGSEASALIAADGSANFSDAAALMRGGRHTEAYRWFVALVDQGDIDPARIALLMYRFGPTAFGNSWDASRWQIAQRTVMREKAQDREPAHVRSTSAQDADRLAMHRLAI